MLKTENKLFVSSQGMTIKKLKKKNLDINMKLFCIGKL